MVPESCGLKGVFGGLEERQGDRSHGYVTGLHGIRRARRSIGINLHKGRQLGFRPHHLPPLTEPPPDPEHVLRTTRPRGLIPLGAATISRLRNLWRRPESTAAGFPCLWGLWDRRGAQGRSQPPAPPSAAVRVGGSVAHHRNDNSPLRHIASSFPPVTRMSRAGGRRATAIDEFFMCFPQIPYCRCFTNQFTDVGGRPVLPGIGQGRDQPAIGRPFRPV